MRHATSNEIRILLVGDIYPGNVVSDSDRIISPDLKRKMETCDLVFGNLECALTLPNQNDLNANKVSLTGHPKTIEELKVFSGLCLANNHSCDAGYEALVATQSLLRENNINSIGCGNNLMDARKPTIFETGDLTVAILGYSCLTTNGENYATNCKSGVAPIALEYIQKDVSEVLDRADIIIVSLHWGQENKHYPTLDQMGLARSVIDCGAHIVWGHHAHVIQPVETYHGGLIAYGLGNFIFEDINFSVYRNETIENRIITQKEENLSSIGIDISISKENPGLVCWEVLHLQYIHGQGVKWVGSQQQHRLYGQYQKKFDGFLKKNRKKKYTSCNPDIRVLFNGEIYQYVYSNPPEPVPSIVESG